MPEFAIIEISELFMLTATALLLVRMRLRMAEVVFLFEHTLNRSANVRRTRACLWRRHCAAARRNSSKEVLPMLESSFKVLPIASNHVESSL